LKHSLFARLLIVALTLPLTLTAAAQGQSPQRAMGEAGEQELPYIRRSADELRRFPVPAGGEGVDLDGWADHTVFARRGPDGALELICLQGDTHELAARVLAPGAEFGQPARAVAGDPKRSSRFANVNATLRVDPDVPAGADGRGRVLLYTPDPIVPGSSRSHFDVTASPNLLMEPGISADLEFAEVDLTDEALRDMGWPNGSFAPVTNYADAQGSGFNDPALGAARRAAMDFVADRWARIIGGGQVVNIQATFQDLTCTVDQGATLAAAGPTFVFRDFPGGDQGVWYPGTTAEAIARQDLSGAENPGANSADLVIFFNSAIDNACLGAGSGYYYGLDGNTPAGQFSFVAVAMHEMGHGLGFTGFSNLATGKLFMNKPDIFTTLMFDNVLGETWDEMRRRERRASAVRDGEVAFAGKKTRRAARKLLAGSSVLTINRPAGLAGTHTVGTSSFSPALEEAGLRGNLALVDDGSATPTLACTALTNAGEIAGKIAVIDRGTCRFDEKSKFAQDAGAIAVIVINNVAGPPVQMGGDPAAGVTIPVVMVDMELGDAIKDELAG